ncbi:hypothetical protein CW751_06250 [Brumimicrobium salinarum]|uniref:Peptidase M23 domain-containing protein n=1 Tax=Brumimicrobium salinarum TaxID=2058658 RepID=A0A2I0R3N0_9FLAO|nr:peptidoglycan DD-metalloendopeptidase family protein [Brumimicrobium salinarum]PKR81183.1 hypothetical protein CW751_06250 [Brumimicrobium salinarum]
MKKTTQYIIGFLIIQLFVLDAFGQGFKLPWNSGTSYYVSRTGSPAPTGGVGTSCGPNSAYNGFNPHGYIAIDFDSPNGVYDPVRAVKAGTVVHAGWAGGYGKLVRIRHSDNTQTYYAHNETIYVSVGQYVEQGCRLADGGNTGNSFGDHIHFEWRDVGGVAFADKRYPNFIECGCKVKPRYCYRSTNSVGSCSGSPCTPPSNDECSSARTITSNGSTLSGTVSCASGSFGPNQCTGCNCSSNDDLDVYYKFTAQASSHTITLSNYASNFDGVIELRSGCTTGTNISCYDPVGVPSSISKTFNNLTIGSTYYIRVYEWNNIASPPSSPTFKIKVTHTCPQPGSIANISGDLTVCENSSQTYSIPAVTNASSYVWSLPSGWTGSSSSSSITANVGATGGEISVIAKNNCGSTAMKTIMVGVTDIPQIPSVISGSDKLCGGGNTTETYSVSPVSGATSFIWNLPSGWSGSSNTTLISATTDGTAGTVSVKASNICGESPTRSLNVSALSLNRNISASGGILTADENNAQYQWINCATSHPINGAIQQTFSPAVDGDYAVVLEKQGCIDTSACIPVSSLGLTYFNEDLQLLAYPNPTRNSIHITLNGLRNEKHTIQFVNATGQVVISKEIQPSNHSFEKSFDMGRLPTGLYFLKISSPRFRHTFKIEKL